MHQHLGFVAGTIAGAASLMFLLSGDLPLAFVLLLLCIGLYALDRDDPPPPPVIADARLLGYF